MKPDWRRAFLYLTAIGMVSCWMYALLTLLNRTTVEGRLSVAGILAFYPLSFILNAGLRRLGWPRFFLLLISWLAWLAGMLLTVKIQLFAASPWLDPQWLLSVPQSISGVIYAFRPELLILLGTGFIWWRGLQLAANGVSFRTVLGEFQFGLVMLVIVSFSAAQFDIPLVQPVLLSLSFFLLGLLGISVAHALEGTSWLSGLYHGHWSGLLLVTISLILLLGLAIGSLVTPELLQLIWSAITWGWGIIWGAIMKVILFFADLFPSTGSAELPAPTVIPPGGAEENFQIWSIPATLRSGLRLAVSLIFSGMMLAALWRISSDIFNWMRRRLGDSGAEYEPIKGAFKDDILNLLKRLLYRLLGLKARFRGGKHEASPAGATSIRHIYRQLLRWAASAGYPRHTSQTPHEYYRTLSSLLPAAKEDLALVTQSYAGMRYGAVLPTQEELSELNHAWHRVKHFNLKKTEAKPSEDKEEN